MPIKLGEAFAYIFVDQKGFKAGMASVHAHFTTGIQKMQVVANKAKIALLLGTAGFGAIAKVAAGFEQGMARVKALTGETGSAFDAMSAQAKELGATTVYTARQASQAMGFFALAGFKSDKIMTAMPATLDLAAAGQMDVAQAADITAKIMAGMGIEAKDLTHTVDVLTKAFTTSNTDLVMLGDAMKYVGPIGKSSGKDIEELTAAIQVMSNAGIQGQMAGTALRNMLLRLQIQPGAVGDQLKALGVDVKDSTGKLKHLGDIIDEVTAATENMGEVEKNAAIGQIAGIRAVSGFMALMEQGGSQIKRFESSLRDAGGTAKRIAETQLNTLQGQFIIMKSAVESAAITFGEMMIPALRGVVKWVQEWARGLAAWDEASVRNALSTAALTGKVLLLLIAMPKVAAVMKVLIGLLGGASINPAVVAVIALTAAVTALGGAWVEAKLTGRDFVDVLKDNISAMLGLNKATKEQIKLERLRKAAQKESDPDDPEKVKKRFNNMMNLRAELGKRKRLAELKVKRYESEGPSAKEQLAFYWNTPEKIGGNIRESMKKEARKELTMVDRELGRVNRDLRSQFGGTGTPEYPFATNYTSGQTHKAPAMSADQKQALRASQQAAYIERRRAAKRGGFGATMDRAFAEHYAEQPMLSEFDKAEMAAIQRRMATRDKSIQAMESTTGSARQVGFSGLQEFSRAIQTNLVPPAAETRDKEKLRLAKEAQTADARKLDMLKAIAKNTATESSGMQE